MKNEEFIDYLVSIHRKVKEIMEGSDDTKYSVLLDYLKSFDEETDVNILKTLLVTTKGVRDNETIKETREGILERFNEMML